MPGDTIKHRDMAKEAAALNKPVELFAAEHRLSLSNQHRDP
jgi:hypothetical protein